MLSDAVPDGQAPGSRRGATGTRTPDLYSATVALFQLSYNPRASRVPCSLDRDVALCVSPRDPMGLEPIPPPSGRSAA